ncbi:MAG TPA: chemotaxis response regulator protein-glutamate methylesterase [Vicinamibacteria bacterium]
MHERRRPIRVLVIDDSAVMRKLLPALLGRDPDIEVVATAVDGVVGLRKVVRFQPDVVTLDLEMPRMAGLDVLREMVAQSEVPVVVVSAHTPRDAALTATALSLGAVDVVAKPGPFSEGGLEAMAAQLAETVRAVGGRRWRRPRLPAPPPPSPSVSPLAPPSAPSRRVVAVAASTGGPAALADLLARLPADLPAAVLVVQHMPEGFTRGLADRLNNLCGLTVREAQDGEPLQAGLVLVAPGGRHLRVGRGRDGCVALLDRGPTVSGHRPSADVLFESVARAFGARAGGVLLTGMGEDGAEGLAALRRAGGRTLAQDEESSVVFGMPRAAVQRGAVERVLPLERIADAVVGVLSRSQAPPPPTLAAAGGAARGW